MAENANVIDELIVRLRLDAEQYEDVNKTINIHINATEQREKDRDAKRASRQRDQNSRMRGLAATAKTLGLQLAAVAGFVSGVGAAIVGTLGGLNAFELGLRRQGVSTGQSNRQLQAWGATARRLGADADAGAEAIASLAREQKQFALTGQAPTLQAFARLGVRVGPDTALPDMLAQAQQVYRRAAPAQQQQIEAQLSAQGVSSDLILMIKSEKDVRQAFTRSLAESTNENRQALDDFSSALAAAKNNAISVANSLATLLQPATQAAASWLSQAAQNASAFTDRVAAAGGGVDGFMKVIQEESPALADKLHIVGKEFEFLGEVVDVVAYGLKLLGETATDIYNWAKGKFTAFTAANATAGRVVGAVREAGQWLGKQWTSLVGDSRTGGPAPAQALERALGATPAPAGTAPAPSAPPQAQALMAELVSRYGLTVPQAAAVTANWSRESGLRPDAVNTAGGGQGALGLGQWRGPRVDAFKRRYGVTPDKATQEQQIEFMLTDPYERALLDKVSLAGGTDAASLGSAYSRIFEAHGNLAEDTTRGRLAATLAAQYNPTAGANAPSTAGGAPTINLNGPISVQADNPQALVTGIQRVSNVQNYNSAVR